MFFPSNTTSIFLIFPRLLRSFAGAGDSRGCGAVRLSVRPGRETVCRVLRAVIEGSHKVGYCHFFSSSLASQMREMFFFFPSLRSQSKRDSLSAGEEFNLTIRMIAEWKHRLQLSVPHHYRPLPSVITVNTSLHGSSSPQLKAGLIPSPLSRLSNLPLHRLLPLSSTPSCVIRRLPGSVCDVRLQRTC